MNVSVQLAAKPSEAVPTWPSSTRASTRCFHWSKRRAAEAETQGYLTDDVVAALRKAGIYTMLFPKEVGGAELRLTTP